MRVSVSIFWRVFPKVGSNELRPALRRGLHCASESRSRAPAYRLNSSLMILVPLLHATINVVSRSTLVTWRHR